MDFLRQTSSFSAEKKSWQNAIYHDSLIVFMCKGMVTIYQQEFKSGGKLLMQKASYKNNDEVVKFMLLSTLSSQEKEEQSNFFSWFLACSWLSFGESGSLPLGDHGSQIQSNKSK